MPRPSSKFAPYVNALKVVSARTGSPLSSLIFSFGVLHELTAIVPLAGLFLGARALGVGDRIVESIARPPDQVNGTLYGNWAREKCREWVNEGGKWVQRVGTRYGIFGFEKRGEDRTKAGQEEAVIVDGVLSARLAGDAANAILAYGLTKALLPVRIGLSLYLAPGFSRRVIEPLRLTVWKAFRRK
ncbi:hypothetical protein K474DRAFT_1658621 [Panus rudis PR-1116 ss-1]|nr:hypothetical protein K474DRAFT_1658621 [Panus rudis PR-1116 ss-1]